MVAMVVAEREDGGEGGGGEGGVCREGRGRAPSDLMARAVGEREDEVAVDL